MNEVYNAAWYANNETSTWPFPGVVRSIDGLELPDSILSDMHLVTKRSDLYVSGIQVSDSFVSVVVNSSAGIVASVTVEQPVVPYKNYVLTSFTPDVCGTVAFGHGVFTERNSWHFSAGTSLLESACLHRLSFPVTSISASTPLTGRVALKPGTDLIIERCNLDLGTTRAAGAVTEPSTMTGVGYKISLSPDAIQRVTSGTTLSEMSQRYIGPCAVRPDNDDCPYITSINKVTPDSNGNIIVKVNDTLLDLSQVTKNISDYVDNSEDVCQSYSELYANTLLLSTDQEYSKEEVSLPIRRCGQDLCEDVASDNTTSTDEPNIVVSGTSDSSTSGCTVQNPTQKSVKAARLIPTTRYTVDSWNNVVIDGKSTFTPSINKIRGMTVSSRTANNVSLVRVPDNYGVVYDTDTSTLSPIDGAAYVTFGERDRARVYAGFRLHTGYEAGILHNITEDGSRFDIFKVISGSVTYNGTQLSNSRLLSLNYNADPLMMITLTLTDSPRDLLWQLTFYTEEVGEIFIGGSVKDINPELFHCSDGIFGLYMKNCDCLYWGVV